MGFFISKSQQPVNQTKQMREKYQPPINTNQSLKNTETHQKPRIFLQQPEPTALTTNSTVKKTVNRLSSEAERIQTGMENRSTFRR